MDGNPDTSQVFMRELFDSLTSLCSFEQVIQCIYGSLEKFIPVSFIMCYYVNHYTSHATTLGYAGNIIDQHRLEATKIHLLSEQMRKDHAYIKDKKIFWMNDYRQDTVVSKNLENIFPNNFSIICITVNDTDLGHIILAFATGQNAVFQPQHVELISDNYELFQSVISKFYPFGEEPSSVVETPLEQAENSVNVLKKCKGMRHVVTCAEAVARTDISVLIEGETGSGKEVLAKAIHLMSKRAQHPIVACNCGALTDSLVDSLLFGHEKGAFTDAHAAAKGFFEQAQNSTSFLMKSVSFRLRPRSACCVFLKPESFAVSEARRSFLSMSGLLLRQTGT